MRLSGTHAIAVLAVGLLGVDLESLVFDPERRCDSVLLHNIDSPTTPQVSAKLSQLALRYPIYYSTVQPYEKVATDQVAEVLVSRTRAAVIAVY